MCPQCVEITNTKIIKNNNFSIVNTISPTRFNIICNTCNTPRKIEVAKSTEKIPCNTCIDNEKIRYVEENTSFKVKSVNGKSFTIVCKCGYEKTTGYHDIKRSKNYQCENCSKIEKIKYIEENTSFKVVSISNGNVKLKCDICNNTKTTSVYTVLSEKHVCTHCTEQEYRDYIHEYTNYSVIEINLSNLKLVCKKCNSIKETTVNQIKRSKNYECNVCTVNERVEHINLSEFTVVNVINTSLFNISCKKCGNNKNITYNDFKKSPEYKCENCIYVEKKKDIEANSTFVVEKIEGKTVFVKCNECKHSLSLGIKPLGETYNCTQCDVRKKVFICKRTNKLHSNRC